MPETAAVRPRGTGAVYDLGVVGAGAAGRTEGAAGVLCRGRLRQVRRQPGARLRVGLRRDGGPSRPPRRPDAAADRPR